MGQFLYSQCSHNPEFADATLQGAQIKQKSLTATSSAVWSKGALTLKISMIWTRYAADYPRSSCGCHQNSFFLDRATSSASCSWGGLMIHNHWLYWFANIYSSVLGVSKWEIRVERTVSYSFSLSVCSLKRELPDATLQGAQIKQKSLRATSSSLWPEGALTLNMAITITVLINKSDNMCS